MCFTRKTKYDMDYDRYSLFSQTSDTLVINRKIISSSDVFCCFGMDSLKSKFNPYGLYFIKIYEQFIHLIGYTVRSGSYGKCDYIIRFHGFTVFSGSTSAKAPRMFISTETRR